MTVQYASDLHLEFPENEDYIKDNPIKPVGDILILAGDICLFKDFKNGKHKDFFDYCSENWKKTFWIAGNHEFYHYDMEWQINHSNRLSSTIFYDKIRSNVTLLNNKSVVIGDVKFIFSILFSHINPANASVIQNRVNDFRVIRYNGRKFRADDCNLLYEDCLSFLKEAVTEKFDGKKVVVTHYVPTLMNYPEQFRGDVLNDTFASEQFEFIEQSNIDYWIYGHHHCNTPDFEINGTKLVTNQLGYVQYGLDGTFKHDKVFLI